MSLRVFLGLSGFDSGPIGSGCVGSSGRVGSSGCIGSSSRVSSSGRVGRSGRVDGSGWVDSGSCVDVSKGSADYSTSSDGQIHVLDVPMNAYLPGVVTNPYE